MCLKNDVSILPNTVSTPQQPTYLNLPFKTPRASSSALYASAGPWHTDPRSPISAAPAPNTVAMAAGASGLANARAPCVVVCHSAGGVGIAGAANGQLGLRLDGCWVDA